MTRQPSNHPATTDQQLQGRSTAGQHDAAGELNAVRERYLSALDAFTAKVQQDRTILAAIVYGSLAYDTVWAKSDIDILLVSRDERDADRDYYLVENGINFHVAVGSRLRFKALLERALGGSFTHSLLGRSRLLFTRDETLREYYEEATHLGAHDREVQLLRAGANLLGVLAKAEKWLYVKHDIPYSCLWIMFALQPLATIEVLLNGGIPGREVVPQALAYNPSFFRSIYIDLIQQPADEAAVRAALGQIDTYLTDKHLLLFAPILRYLSEADGARSVSELDLYFKKRAQVNSLGFAYEWLADRGVLRKLSTPVRMTRKSSVFMDEAAYYYDGDAA